MNPKILTGILLTGVIIVLVVTLSLPNTKQVNGAENVQPEQSGKTKTYYVGNWILTDGDAHLWFAGIQWGDYDGTIKHIVIGHCQTVVYGAAGWNCYIRMQETIHIRNHTFKVIDYGADWITLEEVDSS